MQLHSRHRLTRAGFTLVEMLIVIAILGFAGVALTGAIQFFYTSNKYVLEETSATDNARRGLTTTLQNLREATYGDDGSYPITSAATSSVTFYSDVDNDQAVEKVHIYLANGSLYEGVTQSTSSPATYSGQPEATSTIAAYVSNATSTPIFTYYDVSGNVLSQPVSASQIASVGMTLDVDLNPERAPTIFRLSGTATIRNLHSY